MESELSRAMDNFHILNRDENPCQTFKDLSRKIKQLEGENFQLRLRIYMNEQKMNGASINTFDPFSKNELANEYTMMKKQKDEAEQKLREFQNNPSSTITSTSTKTPSANNGDHNAQKIVEMTRALVNMGTKYNQLEAENKFLHLQQEESQNTVTSLKLSVDRLKQMYESKIHELQEEQSKTANLTVRLEKTQEQLDRSLADVNILRREEEKQMSVKQDQAHNRQVSQLLTGNQDLRRRLGISEDALKVLYQEHVKLVAELRHLKANYNAQQQLLNQHNEAASGNVVGAMGRGDRYEPARHNLSSPDLGIGLESGQEAPSNDNNDDDEISMLRRQKSHLVYKLNQTRQALDKTSTRLTSTTKHKEQVERAVCRQLHKTHQILKAFRHESTKTYLGTGKSLQRIVPEVNIEEKQSLEKKKSQLVLADLCSPILPSSLG